MNSEPTDPYHRTLASWTAGHHAELVAVRRAIHARPELSWQEYATTELVARRLTAAGLTPRVLPRGTGLVVDVGHGARTVALRADLDALPIPDVKNVPYRSTVDGVCHACGHDAHTTIALGTALALHAMSSLPGRVRVIFQPAEERLPGGALEVIAAGELDGVERIFALHCDPRLEVGRVGTRVGPITAACDAVEVRLTGTGGHTARPHLTVDLVGALARIAAESPSLLARAVDVRAGVSLVWGAISAGEAPNTIPTEGTLRGTVRVLDHTAWEAAEKLVRAIVADLAAPTGAAVEVTYVRGVPPVVNDAASTHLLQAAVAAGLGEDALSDTATSMGGEDFAWYGEHVPLSMARLGVHGGGPETMRDLHQSRFDLDERALGFGVRVLGGAAIEALLTPH